MGSQKMRKITDLACRHNYCYIANYDTAVRGPLLAIIVRLFLFAASMALLVACGERGRDASKTAILTAATLGEQSVLTVTEYLAAAPYADADLRNGERLAQICRACHVFANGGVRPDLNTQCPYIIYFFIHLFTWQPVVGYAQGEHAAGNR